MPPCSGDSASSPPARPLAAMLRKLPSGMLRRPWRPRRPRRSRLGSDDELRCAIAEAQREA
eukprot:11222050-Lingulodinium_polyedra.AAC.1